MSHTHECIYTYTYVHVWQEISITFRYKQDVFTSLRFFVSKMSLRRIRAVVKENNLRYYAVKMPLHLTLHWKEIILKLLSQHSG
jgi:hypothetical protein